MAAYADAQGGLVNHLAYHPLIRPLVTTVATTSSAEDIRVYADLAPDGTALPYICVHDISGEMPIHIDGSCGYTEPTLQVDIFAASSPSRAQLRDAVRRAVNGFRGALGHSDQSIPTDVSRIEIVGNVSMTEDRQDGSQDPIYHTALDLRLFLQNEEPARFT